MKETKKEEEDEESIGGKNERKVERKNRKISKYEEEEEEKERNKVQWRKDNRQIINGKRKVRKLILSETRKFGEYNAR
jgi:hypothetical protein